MIDEWFFAESNICITGGTGSLGQALIRRLLSLDHPPRKVISYARRWSDQETLKQSLNNAHFRTFIGDVRDEDRLEIALQNVDMIIHAAAIKSVPDCEYSPSEALQTNISGTWNVIQAAMKCGVERLIFISTDKAVAPLNTYGRSKAFAESLVVAGNSYSHSYPKLSAVRYGNVLGSTGSVLGRFCDLIRDNKPIILTDPAATRFWITMDTAVDFVLDSLEIMRGGEIFIPKLKSSTVLEFAQALGATDIEVSELRPGEKLHELLIQSDENSRVYDMGTCYLIIPSFHTWDGAETYGIENKCCAPPDFIYDSFHAERYTLADLKGVLNHVLHR